MSEQRFRERLTADAPLDAEGNPIDPGDAHPIGHDLGVPTMLVQRELDYLHWLGTQLTGSGRVVELGCFLGGSTAALTEGMRASGRALKPTLVYDSFIAPDNEAVANSWWMKRYQLGPGENFRNKYESIHASRLDRLDIREGWLPENATRAQELEVYPEQEPIELLFVDVAKTWGVHETVLRAFARHLLPGAILIQQDFLDAPTPWLAIHMWQLRDVLEPLDNLRDASTVSFRVVGDVASRLKSISRANSFADDASRESMWKQIHAYWIGVIGEQAAGFVSGHAAMHAMQTGDSDRAIRHARRYAAWMDCRSSEGMYKTPHWSDCISWIKRRFAGEQHKLDMFLEECEIRARNRARLVQTTDCQPIEVRNQVWGGILSDIKAKTRRYALYGAGSHSHWLVEDCIDASTPRPSFLIDDNRAGDSIAGIPVLSFERASQRLGEIDLLLPSSDAHEEKIWARIEQLVAANQRPATRRVYTARPHECASMMLHERVSFAVGSNVENRTLTVAGLTHAFGIGELESVTVTCTAPFIELCESLLSALFLFRPDATIRFDDSLTQSSESRRLVEKWPLSKRGSTIRLPDANSEFDQIVEWLIGQIRVERGASDPMRYLVRSDRASVGAA